jgi:hypothetical protein
MKKQILLFLSAILLSVAGFASNKALNTYTSGYAKTTVAPFTGTTNAFTFEAWFNGSSGTTYARLISFSNFAFEIAAGGGTISIYDGTWRATGATGMGSGWHHVAVTNDLTNFVVYVDGAQIYTRAAVARDFTGQTMFIGAQGKTQTLSERFPGKIDEVRVWNRALSALEIAIAKTKQMVGNESGLIAYYDFNNSSGANKVAGGNYTLTMVSSPTYATTNYVDYVNDFAMNYDANDDKTYFNSTLTGNADFTFEAQFKTTGTSAYYRRIFGWTGFAFEVALNNGMISTYKAGWNSPSVITFNDGVWHHLAVTKSGTTISIYVDGNLLGTRTLTLNLSGVMYIGSSYTSATTEQFGGDLDEVRIWSTVRTQPEIEANMNVELDGDETGLLHYFDFNTVNTATAVTNLVSGGATLTRVGAAGTNNLPQYIGATKNTIVTSVGEFLAPSVLTVYPNPFSSVLTLSNASANKVVVMDITGKAVYAVYSPGSQMDLSSLNAGIYFINVYTDEAMQTVKVIKQ